MKTIIILITVLVIGIIVGYIIGYTKGSNDNKENYLGITNNKHLKL